jgi:hypothetical protein
MTATGDVLLIALLAAFTACAGYVAGRLHQWYLVGVDRDEAYQDGFDTGTRSVFSTAARMIAARRPVRGSAPVVPQPDAPADAPVVPEPDVPVDVAVVPHRDVPVDVAVVSHPDVPADVAVVPSRGGRHQVPDELVQAATYRLPADRVARAKVPGAPASEGKALDADGQDTTRLPPAIPRPRSS